MTSELKPCPFCMKLNNVKMTNIYSIYQVVCKTCRVTALASRKEQEAVSAWNTRAVPDVTELVRYDKGDICLALENGYDPLPSDDGEYVLYDQAVAMLVAKEDECAKYRDYAAEKSNQVAGLQRDNAAKDARIKYLEGAIMVKGGCEHSPTQDAYDLACAAIDKHRTCAETLEADNKRLREALEATHEAISEYYRYQTGGEMRGSYDGKPERDGLWKAMYKARAALGEVKP